MLSTTHDHGIVRRYLQQSIVTSIEYSADWSKNKRWRTGRGRTYANPDTKKRMDALTKVVTGWEWTPKTKLHVDIMVFRPDFRSDPVNFVDTVVDAIKTAVGVDDRYYSGSWDWEVDKENPRFEITVSQTVEQEA